MDGIEATKRIRKLSADIPVLAITAYALHGDREKFIAQGMDGYISKPIRVEQLVEEIEKCISDKETAIQPSDFKMSIDENGEIVIMERKTNNLLNEKIHDDEKERGIDKSYSES